ncbi:hypothetical protein [Acrocarpospora catenulata]|uniref:hypothetical protein n=1 Tax=Acrocarpospora catenulata TaxID=2836182 RepID=UPI001BDAB08B|nr:hypothetical protein [Acrocarpospora catenulata]
MADEHVERSDLGIDGDPAFLLDEGVSYVRAWAEAQCSVSALKEALASMGRNDELPYLRADVNEFGTGFVELGRASPQMVRLIAHALALMASSRNIDGGGFAA